MIRAVIAFLCFICVARYAVADPLAIRLCAENEDAYPWVLNGRPGLDLILLKRVENTIGIPISIRALPWKRCVAEVQAGNLDGAIKTSFKPERLELGVYPMLNGQPDDDKRLHTESYHLYVRKDSKVGWDGQRLMNVDGPVGAQFGFSVVSRLKELGAKVDDSTISAYVNLEKLSLGRVGAVALQTREADHVLAANGKFEAIIMKMEPALAEKSYFLMLSRQFFAQYPSLSNTIWTTIAVERKSKEFQATFNNFQ